MYFLRPMYHGLGLSASIPHLFQLNLWSFYSSVQIPAWGGNTLKIDLSRTWRRMVTTTLFRLWARMQWIESNSSLSPLSFGINLWLSISRQEKNENVYKLVLGTCEQVEEFFYQTWRANFCIICVHIFNRQCLPTKTPWGGLEILELARGHSLLFLSTHNHTY